MDDGKMARVSCPASRRSTASPKSSLSPSEHGSAEASLVRRVALLSRRESRCLCTTRRKAGMTRRIRTARCSSTAKTARKLTDVRFWLLYPGSTHCLSYCACTGVAFTAKMVTPKAAAQGAFYFQKIFTDGEFLAAGQLVIPPNSTKPTKSTRDNTFVRTIISPVYCHYSADPRYSTSSKALSSSVYTRQTSSLPLVACLWFREASLSPCIRLCNPTHDICRQRVLYPEHMRPRRDTLLRPSTQDGHREPPGYGTGRVRGA